MVVHPQAFPHSPQLGHCGPGTGNLWNELLQCVLCGASLGLSPQAGADCSKQVVAWPTLLTPLLLRELKWQPICYWAQFSALLLAFKAINNLVPACLRDCLTLYFSKFTSQMGTAESISCHGGILSKYWKEGFQCCSSSLLELVAYCV